MGVVKNNDPARGRNFKHGTGFKNKAPCVVQWSLLWFSAPTNLNRILGRDLKIKKYHEVVNRAIMDAVGRPFSGERTPKSCMFTSVARVLQRTHKKWRVNKEMKGWKVGEIFISFLLKMMMKKKAVMNDL